MQLTTTPTKYDPMSKAYGQARGGEELNGKLSTIIMGGQGRGGLDTEMLQFVIVFRLSVNFGLVPDPARSHVILSWPDDERNPKIAVTDQRDSLLYKDSLSNLKIS